MLFFAEVYQIQHLRCEDTQILSYKHQVHQKSFNILTIYNYTHHSALFRVQNKGTLRNYVQSSEPPNMVCNLPTLVCRYLILYFQHPTTVKNHLHFHTFCIKMAAARQKKQVNLLFCTHLAHFFLKSLAQSK